MTLFLEKCSFGIQLDSQQSDRPGSNHLESCDLRVYGSVSHWGVHVRTLVLWGSAAAGRAVMQLHHRGRALLAACHQFCKYPIQLCTYKYIIGYRYKQCTVYSLACVIW